MVNLLNKINQTPNADYRNFYLDHDKRNAQLAIIFFCLPIVGFIINDYQLFSWSTNFFSLVALRIVLLSIICVGLFRISKVKNSGQYDTLLLTVIFLIMVGGGIINLFRPPEFAAQAIITIVSIFIIYLVIPLRFLHQSILATLVTVGEAAIIVLVVKPTEPTVLFSLLFSLFLVNLIAALSSWQLHTYRKRTYEEFVKRQAIQDKLEQHTLNLEELVDERTRKLKNAERFAAIGATAGMVGHDLRNPLSGIANASYYLKRKYSDQLDQQGRDMLQIIDSNIVYSNKIISDLLDYSGQITLDLARTNLKHLIKESLAMSTFPHNIEVRDFTEDHEVIVDATKLKRVFINLIKNAIEAMPQGGVLKIKTEKTPNAIKISFVDTGTGITEQEQKNLFQPLFTTKAQGMGFGLAICQRIVEAHKGTIKLDSPLGAGASFVIELPIK